MLTTEPLLAYLRDLTEDTAHGALHPLISGIWRWEGEGNLTRYDIGQASETREGDWIDRVYCVVPLGHTHKPDCLCRETLTFTARIDAHVVDKEP